MNPFPGVKATLEWIQRQGIPIVAVSNGPIYQTSLKLKKMHLSKYFDGLVGWEGFDPPTPDDPYTAGYIGVRRGGEAMRWSTHLPYEELKPSTAPYAAAISRYEIATENIWVVGDSLSSDIPPGEALGLQTIWAQYGTRVEEADLATLLAITDWTDTQIRALKQPPPISPKYTIHDFRELEDLLPTREAGLFSIVEAQ